MWVFKECDKDCIFFNFVGDIEKGKYDLGDLLGKKRLLVDEEKNENGSSSSSLVLAQERTTRKDPLNKFKKYRGGWNIKERHYWAVSFVNFVFFILLNVH